MVLEVMEEEAWEEKKGSEENQRKEREEERKWEDFRGRSKGKARQTGGEMRRRGSRGELTSSAASWIERPCRACLEATYGVL